LRTRSSDSQTGQPRCHSPAALIACFWATVSRATPVSGVAAWVVAAATETTAASARVLPMRFMRAHGASDRPRPQPLGPIDPPSERATPLVQPSRSPRRLEAADAVRRTDARGAVVAGLGGAEVAAHRVRREVRPLRDVVEARLVAVGIRAVHQRLRVAG